MVREEPLFLVLPQGFTWEQNCSSPCTTPALPCFSPCAVWAQVRIAEGRSLLFPQPIRKGQREVYAGLGPRGI